MRGDNLAHHLNSPRSRCQFGETLGIQLVLGSTHQLSLSSSATFQFIAFESEIELTTKSVIQKIFIEHLL